MRFVGMIWRLLVGVKDALVLLFMLLFFALIYAALSAKPYAGSVREGALLIELTGSIVEQPAEAAPLDLVTGASMVSEHRLRDIVRGLQRAATDGRIKAVALDLDIFAGGGQTAIADVGAALDQVRGAGKPVVAYASGYTDDSYQLAAHASEIWLNPLGGVLLTGPGGTNLYYKGLLDRLGVTANVYRVGTYKAAVEPYTRSDMSPEAREASQALYGALWEIWLQDVARARPKAQLQPYIANPAGAITAARGDMAQAALTAGLVDRVGDRYAFEQRMAEIVGKGGGDIEPRPFKQTPLDAWVAVDNEADQTGNIGVLTVAGTIMDGEAGLGTAGADTIAATLRKGLATGNLKALVVRVDSPGGSVLGSERIRQAVLEAKAAGLPVVVSMGSVAASGGYWIATAGDTIMAEPATITGSIGVFGILPSFEGTLAKLGVGADGIKTTPLSGEPNVLGGIAPEADRIIQLGVESTYRRFLQLVSESRDMPVGRANQLAQGRVWDGGTARQLGLIDKFGRLQDAIAEAARLAKIDPADARPHFLEREPGFAEMIFGTMRAEQARGGPRDVFSKAAATPELLMARAIGDARQILSGPAIQARCLECPSPTAPPLPRERSLGDWLLALMRD